MLSFIFIFLAAVCNAVMDTFIFRVDRSVFRKIGVEKLSPIYTWQTYGNFLGIVRLDPYHIVKFGMIGFIILAAYFYKPILGVYDLPILAACWFVGFELFWAKILYKP